MHIHPYGWSQSLEASPSAISVSGVSTSELNLASFLAYCIIAGTLIDPVQFTQLKHWLKAISCSTPSSTSELLQITRQWLGTEHPRFERWLTMQKSQLSETSPEETSVPASTLPTPRPSSTKKRSLVLTLIMIMVRLTRSWKISWILAFSGSMKNSWKSDTWSPVQLFWNITTSFGRRALRARQALIDAITSSTILPKRFWLESQPAVAEKMELQVELMVAQRPRTFLAPTLALSKASSMQPSILQVGLGTQRVLPRLAMIWRSTLVAMDWMFLLRSLTSVKTWVTICRLQMALVLICRYCVLRLLGMIMQQMLSPPSIALSISLSMRSVPMRSISYLLMRRVTPRLVEVLLKVSSTMRTSVPRWKMTARLMGCLLAKMGLLKRLKQASLPRSTALSRPSSSTGEGMIFALRSSMFWFTLIPILSRVPRSSTFFSLRISPPISLCFSPGGRIVNSEIFFRRISSKSSGMPVMSMSSGTRRVILSFFLFSATRSGCRRLLMVTWYLSLQQSTSLTCDPSNTTLSRSLYWMSVIVQQLVFPQFDITTSPASAAFTTIRRSSFSRCLLMRQRLSMCSSTVQLRTIFLAASTRRQYPFSSDTKLDLKPLYIVSESMLVFSLELKYLPDLPISTQLSLRMQFLRVLLRKASSKLGLDFRSYTFTFFTRMRYSPAWYSSYPPAQSYRLQMFMPDAIGFLMSPEICSNTFFSSVFRSWELSCGMKGSYFTEKMEIWSICFSSTQQWLDIILVDLKLSL